jgi:carboxyl-terminal processing protease
MNKKISFNNIIIALVFFGLGYVSFDQISEINKNIQSEQNLDLFWKVHSTLEERYPFQEPTSKEKMFGAIKGLVDSYDDDYSSFLPPEENKFFTDTISGEFGGIGAEIGIRGGYLAVVSPLKFSPAEKAGMLPGDIITHVDGRNITGKSLDGAISLIRGEIGTIVTLEIIRFEEEEPIEISITRDVVVVPVLDTKIIKEAFVISLYNFNDLSEDSFREAITEFKKSGKEKLLIDVRNNPGGFLTSAVDMASHFLPQGEIVLREEHGLGPEDQTEFRSTGSNLLEGYEFETIVLINEGSASASEILAGALRDHGVARIVGETSFGKGSVQELIQLPEKTSLKITIAKWLTPNGDQISDIGIKPDVYIPFNPESETDTQLFSAIDVFALE